MKKNSKSIGRIIGILIIIIVFLFIFKKLAESWGQVSKYSFQINPILIIVSLIVLSLAFLSASYGWLLLLRKLGVKIKTKTALLIFIKTQLSRYVPGVIWQYLGRVHLAKKQGIPSNKVIISMLLESILFASAAGIISVLSLLPYLKSSIITSYYIYLLPILLLALMFHPKVLDIIITTSLKILKKDKEYVKIKLHNFSSIFGVYIARYLLLGVSFVIFTNSIYKIEVINWPLVFGASVLSWLVGYLFIIVPGGIGIKEGIIVLLLQDIMPLGIAIIISLASRVWLITGEIITFIVVRLIKSPND